MKKFLYLLVLVLVAWFAWGKFETPSVASQSPAGANVEVILYATDWCGYCRKAKEFFDANGIAYSEFNIDNNAAARQEFERLGGRGVPLVVIGETVIRGYSEEAMKSALGL